MSDQAPTNDELARVIRACAGIAVEPERLAREPGPSFEELGVDSLGVLGVVTEIENRYGVRLGVDAEQCQRPAQLRGLVRAALDRPGAGGREEVTDARAH